MPAHVPRRHFAKPFIVTVAAASAACHEPVAIGDNPPHNPPAQDTALPSATAAPIEPTEAASSERKWTVSRDPGTFACIAMANVECEPNVDCNPPPPSAYACPANLPNYPAVVFQHKGETACVTTASYCPPGSFCNPPPTQIVVVPCPK